MILFEDLHNGIFDKILEGPSERRLLPLKLPIDKIILNEVTFRVMRITLSKMKRSLCTIAMAETRYQ